MTPSEFKEKMQLIEKLTKEANESLRLAVADIEMANEYINQMKEMSDGS